MTIIETLTTAMEFNRGRTIGLLEQIADQPAALGWRPGQGRAHIAWQLTHIGVTEEIFATERLMPERERAFEELWPRFRGGSTPDDDIPDGSTIRRLLDESRKHLFETLKALGPSKLDEVAFVGRGKEFTLHETIQLVLWHEAHHQGQAHITLNLYNAQSG